MVLNNRSQPPARRLRAGLLAGQPERELGHPLAHVGFLAGVGQRDLQSAARGHVVIDNPYALHGVTAATYRPCPRQPGFFAQGFAFTDGRIRGCVPLEVRVGGEPQVRRVTLSLFAGFCAS